MNGPEKYLNMQEKYYEGEAAKWSLDNKDPVVSWYHEHGRHADYDTCLFRGFDTTGLCALDYGCGPGRSMIRYKDRFAKIDGVDIAEGNLEAAKVNLKDAGIPIPFLLKNNGCTMPEIPDNTYDVVFSVICLQHICSHDIRYTIMAEGLPRIEPGGYFCAQMGFGSTHLTDYFANNYDAQGTNGAADVGFTEESFLINDLTAIGYVNYSSVKRPAMPRPTPTMDLVPGTEMVNIVIEVGFSTGLDTQKLRLEYPNATYYGFEPALSQYKNLLVSDDQLNLMPFAISSKNGFAMLNIATKEEWGCSSLFDFNTDIKELWPRTDFEMTEKYKVPTIRLDTFIENFIEKPKDTIIEYLWIDAQGSDIDALYSLGPYIDCVRKGRVEVALTVELYNNTNNTLKNAIKFFVKNGFYYAITPDHESKECNIEFWKD